jgi:hypothetical protein
MDALIFSGGTSGQADQGNVPDDEGNDEGKMKGQPLRL